MSNDIAAHSHSQVVPANDSCGMDTYEELVLNSDLFWDTLRDFLRHSDKVLKIPIVGGKSLDLHRLFIEVTSRGGLEKVIKDRKCKQVIGAFNFKTRVTNAAFVLKKYYLKMLFEFEHVYYFQDPISLFWAREESLMRLVQKSAILDKGNQELEPGFEVSGIIDGKFDSGYLVTVKIGSEVLKGVLYHTTQACLQTPRRKKKKKKKKSNNTQGLKLSNAGQERSLIKEIGNMWGNLSATDRQVYQDKGSVERYKKEMLHYTSSLRTD